MRLTFVWLALIFVSAPTVADIFRPAYLELREAGDDRYEVLFKVPTKADGRRLMAHVRLPDDARVVSKPRAVLSGGAWTERYIIEREGGLEGTEIAIDGLAGGVTDVIVRVERQDGETVLEGEAWCYRFVPEET